MKRSSLLTVVALLFVFASLFPDLCFAGTDTASAATDANAASPDSTAPADAALSPTLFATVANPPFASSAPSPAAPQAQPAGSCCWFRFGLGADASTLGFGAQLAVQVLQRANVRVGLNLFDYHGSLTNDGIFYTGNLNLRSVNADFDYFLFRNIHVSPGLLIYDDNNGRESASVAGGQGFVIGNTTYESSTASPVAVNAALNVNKIAPELLVGIGNLVPRGRDRRRWGIDFEGGVAFQGSPKVSLGLSGFACIPPNSAGPTCANAATDPSIQASDLAQETKLEHKLSFMKFYPVLSLGISYSF